MANASTTPEITLTSSVTGILEGNGTSLNAASTTGTGRVVRADSPTLTAPTLGDASATSLNLSGGDLTVNTDQLFIDQSTGRIGIGTATPTAPVEIVFADEIDITPAMSGSNTLGNYVANQSGSGESTLAWMVFDGSTLTYWYHPSGGNPTWVSLDFGVGNEQTVTRYTIVPKPEINGAPRTFKLLGSNVVSPVAPDPLHADWVEVDDVPDKTNWAFEESEFFPHTPGSYRHYALYTSAGFGGNFTQFSELKFFSAKSCTTTFASTGVAITGPVDAGSLTVGTDVFTVNGGTRNATLTLSDSSTFTVDSQGAVSIGLEQSNATTPYTVTGTATYSGAPWNAFKSSSAFYFSSNHIPEPWVKIDFVSAKTITEYSIKVPAAEAGSGQTAKDFKLQGSDNDSTWTDVDIRTGVSTWASEPDLTISFICNATTGPYRFYRIYVTDQNSANYYTAFTYIDLKESGPATIVSASGLGIGITPSSYLLDVAGVARSTQSTFDTGSDPRVKENIIDHPEALPTVMALHPIRFNFKKGYRPHAPPTETGFDASEFKAVLPQAVRTLSKEEWSDPEAPASGSVRTPIVDGVGGDFVRTYVSEADFNANNGIGGIYEGCVWEETTPAGVDGVTGFQVINPSPLLPLLVKALQEANDKIDALEARVAALEP